MDFKFKLFKNFKFKLFEGLQIQTFQELQIQTFWKTSNSNFLKKFNFFFNFKFKPTLSSGAHLLKAHPQFLHQITPQHLHPGMGLGEGDGGALEHDNGGGGFEVPGAGEDELLGGLGAVRLFWRSTLVAVRLFKIKIFSLKKKE